MQTAVKHDNRNNKNKSQSEKSIEQLSIRHSCFPAPTEERRFKPLRQVVVHQPQGRLLRDHARVLLVRVVRTRGVRVPVGVRVTRTLSGTVGGVLEELAARQQVPKLLRIVRNEALYQMRTV